MVAKAKVTEGKWKDPAEADDAEPEKPKKAAAAKTKKADGDAAKKKTAKSKA